MCVLVKQKLVLRYQPIMVDWMDTLEMYNIGGISMNECEVWSQVKILVVRGLRIAENRPRGE